MIFSKDRDEDTCQDDQGADQPVAGFLLVKHEFAADDRKYNA